MKDLTSYLILLLIQNKSAKIIDKKTEIKNKAKNKNKIKKRIQSNK